MGGAPAEVLAVELALPAKLERLFLKRRDGGANAMKPRFARHGTMSPPCWAKAASRPAGAAAVSEAAEDAAAMVARALSRRAPKARGRSSFRPRPRAEGTRRASGRS
jgi:hypothetical protein